jgi:peptidoglycan LD-endopeptidase LytH
MVRSIKTKYIILVEIIVFLAIVALNLFNFSERDTAIYVSTDADGKDYIKWVNFDISSEALKDAYDYDVRSQKEEVKINWIELLAILGNKYGGDFSRYRSKHMAEIVGKLQSKEETIASMTDGMKYYKYYKEAYDAVLGGMVGSYKIEVADKTAPGGKVWEERYGLKAFLPIAKYYPFSHFDDFGVSRSYGFRRKHLGHDMMGQVGTPIIAVESGYVEALGWNQYGGWRIGIRSFDKKRYYYYAHLRKNFPYNKELQVGSLVQAGDVIGYLGRTGYSSNENANNIRTPHLHFGMQLIFDESQKESYSEIWIDCYDIIKFLCQNRCETAKNQETKEYRRVYQMVDPIYEHYNNHSIYKYNDDEFKIHIYE